MARNLAKLLLVGVLLASGVLLPGCAGETQAPLEPPRQAVSLDELPEFSGDPFVEVNGNVPSFSEAERDLARARKPMLPRRARPCGTGRSR